MIANTPPAPYYAVIFSSLMSESTDGYDTMAEVMVEKAKEMDGFLGIESARSEVGITVSYWRDLAAITAWKAHAEHQVAQKMGKSTWYAAYKVRITRVERDYSL